MLIHLQRIENFFKVQKCPIFFVNNSSTLNIELRTLNRFYPLVKDFTVFVEKFRGDFPVYHVLYILLRVRGNGEG